MDALNRIMELTKEQVEFAIKYYQVMTKIEWVASGIVEVTQWMTSVLAAFTWQTIVSNKMILGVTFLACLLGTGVYYKLVLGKPSKATTVVSVEKTTKSINPSTIETDNSMTKKLYASINLTATDETFESEDDESEADDHVVTKLFVSPMNVVSEDEEEVDDASDKDDWNEQEYNQKYPRPSSTNTTRGFASASAENIQSPPQTPMMSPVLQMRSPKTRAQKKKKETLTQMRKRVARQMKESEERRNSQRTASKTPSKTPGRATTKSASATSSKKINSRNESVREMKARVAREFAAKRKQ